MLFTQARQRAEVLREQSVVLCGKKNPLWDTLLHCDTRSVPYLKGRTVARRSFPEAFLEVSATYDNGSRSGRAVHLHGETCAIAARKPPVSECTTTLIKFISSYFPGNF